ncbi:MAG TPA: EF-hand domain-containing protein [Hyphomicrobiales bacterium]
MRNPALNFTVCLLAAGLVTGCAGSGGPDLSTTVKNFLGGIASYDLNHDDVVTCDEWRTAAGNLFNRADRAGAGVLTEADYEALGKIDRTYVGTFKTFDVNHDGKVDKKEFVERPNPAFTYADKDKDCKLTQLEMATARNLSAPPKEAKATDPNSAVGPTNPTGSSRY